MLPTMSDNAVESVGTLEVAVRVAVICWQGRRSRPIYSKAEKKSRKFK